MPAIELNLIVQVWCYGEASVSNEADNVTSPYLLPCPDIEAVEMGIDSLISKSVIEDDMIAVTAPG